jgi:hypothetical protein
VRLSTVVLITLTALLSLTGLFIKNACGRLLNPEADVIPPEAYIGQQVDVKAKISVKSG